jgi:endonuclease/exonuclease/phosphatase family metal-dependent hydrolase
VSKHVSPRRFRIPHLRLVAPAAALTVVATVAAVAGMIDTDQAPASTEADLHSEPVAEPSLVASQPSVTPLPPPTTKAPTRSVADKGEKRKKAKAATVEEKKKNARQRRLADRVEAVAQELDPVTTFRIASFNVLGDSHTGRGGDKPGYAAGPTRVGWAAQALNAAGVDVVGFQEYESVQHNAFMRRTGGAWAAFPGTSLGSNPVRNSIAWRRSTWTAIELKTIPIPYFRGNRVPMPYVLLENNETGQRVWIINVHNPTSNNKRGNNERWRDVGTSMQVNLMNNLKADGIPVILMGDFNERAEAFCRVTSGAGAHAANGGTTSPCRPPAGQGIDWIFGTPSLGFGSYVRLRTPLIARTTDHPLVAATATIGAS